MRKFLLYIILLICISPNLKSQERRKVAVVLSGGGAKGVAHVGVLKVLEKAGIPIDYIVGTSMGAIVGGLYSIGYSSEQLDKLIKEQNWNLLLSDKVYRYNLPFYEKDSDETYLITMPLIKDGKISLPSGFISGQNIYNLFLNLTLGYQDSISFNKLPIPFACIAADLSSGKEVVIRDGKLATAMRASMAIPGVFTPVKDKGMLLVDGGIVNNFPVNIAKKMGADIVIGVDVGSSLKPNDEIKSVIEVFQQMSRIMTLKSHKENVKMLDLYIKPNIYPYSTSSFDNESLDSLINRGEVMAKSMWDDIIKLKEKIPMGKDEDLRHRIKNPYINLDTIRISEVKVSGVPKEDHKWLIRKFGSKKISTKSDISKRISSIYGTGLFSKVYGRLEKGETNNFLMNIDLTPKPANKINLGFRFDSDNHAAILMNSSIKLKNSLNSTFFITSRLSTRPYVKIGYSLGNTIFLNGGISYKYGYSDVNIYDEGKRVINSDFVYHEVDLKVTDVYVRNLNFKLGLKYEYFKHISTLGKINDIEHPDSRGFISYYANGLYDTYDRKYYPESGVNINFYYRIYTDNGYSYSGREPFSAIGFSLSKPIRLTRRVYLMTSAQARFMIGGGIPFYYMNFVGGYYDSNEFTQQIAFEGIKGVEITDDYLTKISMGLRYRLGARHYLKLKYSIGSTVEDGDGLIILDRYRSLSFGYSYDSFIGPLDVNFSHSNRDSRIKFHVNIGYYF